MRRQKIPIKIKDIEKFKELKAIFPNMRYPHQCKVFKILKDNPDDAFSIKELVTQTKLAKPTVYSALASLRRMGYIEVKKVWGKLYHYYKDKKVK